MKLLTTANYKTVKGEKLGYLTGILYLAPSNTVKGINVCKHATSGCKLACLYSAGQGAFNCVQKARIKKTELFRDNTSLFFELLKKDITALERKAKKLGLVPCIRLNGTSDIYWQKIVDGNGNSLFDLFPNIQFYDYTANYDLNFMSLPKNYSVTFSRKENNEKFCMKLLHNGTINVAMVFKTLPSEYRGYKVVNGDISDVRFIDDKGVIIGLSPKGKAKRDSSNFVIQ